MSCRSITALLTAALASGCAGPFDASYYSLSRPRIIAASALPADGAEGAVFEEGEAVILRAFVYRDAFYPADHSLQVRWFIPPEASPEAIAAMDLDALTAFSAPGPGGAYLGEGVDLAVTITSDLVALAPAEGPLFVALTLTGDGLDGPVDERAYITIPTQGPGQHSPVIGAITRAAVPALTIIEDGPTEPALWAADSRRGHLSEAAGVTLAPGAAARLSAELSDADGDDLTLKWIAGPGRGGYGTLLPLGAAALDWASATLFEGEGRGAELMAEKLPPGLHTFAAVATDGRGGVGVKLVDIDLRADGEIPVDVAAPVIVRSGERLLWGDVHPNVDIAALTEHTGPLQATLMRAEGAPGGLLLSELMPGPTTLEAADPFGIAGCAEGGLIQGPLTLSDLAWGRCTLDELLGVTALWSGEVVSGVGVAP